MQTNTHSLPFMLNSLFSSLVMSWCCFRKGMHSFNVHSVPSTHTHITFRITVLFLFLFWCRHLFRKTHNVNMWTCECDAKHLCSMQSWKCIVAFMLMYVMCVCVLAYFCRPFLLFFSRFVSVCVCVWSGHNVKWKYIGHINKNKRNNAKRSTHTFILMRMITIGEHVPILCI